MRSNQAANTLEVKQIQEHVTNLEAVKIADFKEVVTKQIEGIEDNIAGLSSIEQPSPDAVYFFATGEGLGAKYTTVGKVPFPKVYHDGLASFTEGTFVGSVKYFTFKLACHNHPKNRTTIRLPINHST